MNTLSEVFWFWDKGSVTTKLFYSDQTKKEFYLSEPPPTTPAHDISHFICGFHSNLEWDFSLEPNHFAEYNAVFMEHLLFLLYRHPNISKDRLKNELNVIFKHMKWFCEEYYKIPQSFGSKYSSDYLKKRFLNNIDPIITSKLYKDFYLTTFLSEKYKLKGDQINIQLTIDPKDCIIDDKCYNFINLVKELGN